MQDLAVYMVTHKKVSAPNDSVYIPIQAGSAVNGPIGVLRDDCGDNISHLNKKYSEMTALYWIWKNAHSENVGLVHYRRFFVAKNYGLSHAGHTIASGQDLFDQMQKCDLMIVEPLRFFFENTFVERSVELQYVNTHRPFDLLQARRAVAELKPQYIDSFDYVMRCNILVPFNLFVARRSVMQAFCSWMFDLFELIDSYTQLPTDEDSYQGRVIAFLSERLFTVWAAHHRKDLRIAHRPYVFYDGI